MAMIENLRLRHGRNSEHFLECCQELRTHSYKLILLFWRYGGDTYKTGKNIFICTITHSHSQWKISSRTEQRITRILNKKIGSKVLWFELTDLLTINSLGLLHHLGYWLWLTFFLHGAHKFSVKQIAKYYPVTDGTSRTENFGHIQKMTFSIEIQSLMAKYYDYTHFLTKLWYFYFCWQHWRHAHGNTAPPRIPCAKIVVLFSETPS